MWLRPRLRRRTPTGQTSRRLYPSRVAPPTAILLFLGLVVLVGLVDLLGWPGLANTPLTRPAHAQVVDCNRCHGDAEFLVGKGESREAEALLLVPDSHLVGSAHDSLSCTSCHSGYDDAYPHQPNTSTAACADCHEDQQTLWHASVHGPGFTGRTEPAGNSSSGGRGGEPNGASDDRLNDVLNDGIGTVEGADTPDCARCHSVHRILPASDRESPIHPLNEAALCSECHEDPRIIEAYFSDPEDSVAAHAATQYHETVHGLAIENSGLTVSATCSDCHRPHLILPSVDERSSVHRNNVMATCGDCHLGVLEVVEASAHGKALREANPEAEHEAPVCTSCHSSHGVVAPDEAWRADVVEECGSCHEELYATYDQTHHGKITRLGGPLGAKCSDCHTAHANLSADDPKSTVHPANLVDTCGECHAGANTNFVLYHSHGNRNDRENYPILYYAYLAMRTLLACVFTFFGIHTLLWLSRSVIERSARFIRRNHDESAKGDTP